MLEALMLATGGARVLDWPVYLTRYLPTYMLTASEWFAARFPSSSNQPAFFPSYPSGVLWTLTVELSFYFALPLFLTAAKAWPRLGSVLIVVAAALSFAAASASDSATYVSHPLYNILVGPYFWVFAIGVLARLHWDRVERLFRGSLLAWI